MASAKLKFDEKEITIGEETVTFGRTAENTVSFLDNPNISRNHATIEFRNGSFWLTDLGSSNGTTVNGQNVDGEIELNDGDFITLGNSVIIEYIEDEMPEDVNDNAASETQSAQTGLTANGGGKSSKVPVMLGVTGAVGGLAVVFAVAAVYVGFSGETNRAACSSAARLVSPRNGETISEETNIKVEVTNPDCGRKVIVVLNRKVLHTFEDEPYTTTLDPNKDPDLADGRPYPLEIVLEDPDGNKFEQLTAVNLFFETKEVATPTPTVIAQKSETPPPVQQGKQITLDETQRMTADVVKKLNVKVNISNTDFLQEVRKKSAEFATDGYYQRAAVYKDVIRQSFVREKSLDASLAYILAMSRSKFNLQTQGANQGLWQMSSDFATANAYNVVCTNFNLTDPSQECAAKVAAFYVRDLVDAFDGDIVYAVAVFGKTAGEANALKSTLQTGNPDFWKVITDQNMRDQIARFFAAAIVAENPQRFKLKDRPLSELYLIPTVQ